MPGPSTRYHKSEHARPKPTPRNSTQHTRNPSALSSRSSLTEHSASASPLARLNFSRDNPKDYCYNPKDYSPTPGGTIKPNKGPFTPLRSPHTNSNNLRFQNSPFSDYFTDDARSVEHNAPYHPSDPAQKLLLRLNILGSDILRLGLSTDSFSDFSEKLCLLEAMVHDGPYSDTTSLTEDLGRRASFSGPFSIEDRPQGHEAREYNRHSPDQFAKSRLSGVWSADAFEYADSCMQTDAEPQYKYASSSTQTQEPEARDDMCESAVWVQDTPAYADMSIQTADDRLVTELQQVVQRLAKANDSLRHHHDQTKDLNNSQSVQIEKLSTQFSSAKSENDSKSRQIDEMSTQFTLAKSEIDSKSRQIKELSTQLMSLNSENDSQSLQIEELSTQLMSVKSENDTLKQDLGFDHSELLFLKLQLQAIEVQTNSLDRNNRVLLAEDLDKWKSDWDNVDARLRSRRQKNRVPSAAPLEDLATRGAEVATKTEDQGLWRLETRKHRHGRVRSITLKRVDEPDTQVDESELIDAQHDISTNPVTKVSYCEHFTQTEVSPVEVQTQPEVVAGPEHNEESGDEKETEDEEPLQYSQLHCQSQQPVPVPDKQEQLCRACGGDIDYSSSEDDEETDTKTPWRELCDGLVAFAGMQRD